MLTKQTRTAYIILRYTFGLMPLIVGVDKFLNLLTYWGGYMSPVVVKLLPVPIHMFMIGVGIFEISIGVLILTKWTKLGAYLLAAYLFGVTINLITFPGLYDIALRDLALVFAALALAKLAEADAR